MNLLFVSSSLLILMVLVVDVCGWVLWFPIGLPSHILRFNLLDFYLDISSLVHICERLFLWTLISYIYLFELL